MMKFRDLTKFITRTLAVTVVGVAAMTTTSCELLDDAEYPVINELIAPTSVYEVSEEQGVVEIPIYAKGGYSIEVMDNYGGNWFTLSSRHMTDDGVLKVEYRQNSDFRRMVALRLALDTGARADTVYVKQAGIVPMIECNAPFKAVNGDSEEAITIPVDTNIPFEDFSISYTNGGENWLKDINIEDGALSIVPKVNATEAPRSSIVSLAYVDGWGEELLLRVFITQSDKNNNFGRILSFEEVRGLASEVGTAIDEDINIKGWIVSDFRSKNMALNPNTNYAKVDTSVSDRTAYIESEDGRLGFRLEFENVTDNELRRYSLMQISLKGATIVKENNPDRYAIVGLRPENLLSGEAGSADMIPAKRKSINALTDDDIYTYVTLENTEFVFKDGAYINVYENYAQLSDVNYINSTIASKRCSRMDGWASLLYDANGDGIYMMVNTLCQWRRSGNGVPQGSGDMRGIIVHAQHPRYGDYMGRYQIRPVDEEDILSIGNSGARYKTFAEYNGKYAVRFGLYTVANGFGKAYPANGVNSVLPPDDAMERPNVELRCENVASSDTYPINGAADYNSPDLGTEINGVIKDTGYVGTAWASKGEKTTSAFCFNYDVSGWYKWAVDEDGNKTDVNGYNGIRLDFSTKNISGSKFCLALTCMGGDASAANAKAYPAHWCVEYSTDSGATWTLANDKVICDSYSNQPYFKMRSHPWWDATVNANKYYTPYGAGLGYTDHIFFFPVDIFGKDKVSIRIRPYDTVLASLPLQWDGSVEQGVVRPSTSQKNKIRFGTISLRFM